MGKVNKSKDIITNIDTLDYKLDDKLDKDENEHILNENDSQYKIHQMSLNESMFDLVKSRKKTIEGRIYDNKRSIIKIGDFINFKKNNSDETIMVQVLKITKHGDFEKALRSGKLKNMLPGFRTVKEGIEYYYKFPNYEKKSKELGVVNFYIATNSLEYE